MMRALAVCLALCLFVSVAGAGVIKQTIDFESGLPSNVSAFGNAGIIGDFGVVPLTALPAIQGSSMFGASTGVGSTPFGSPVAAGTGPASFIVGNPYGLSGVGTPVVTEYSGIAVELANMDADHFIDAIMHIATGEVTGGVQDFIGIWMDDGSGAVLVQGYVIDADGTLTLAAPFVGLDGSDFTGATMTDPMLGIFADGVTGGYRLHGVIPMNPSGTTTIYVAAVDYDDTDVNTGFLLDNIRINPVPEPGTMALFGLGALGLVAWSRRRKRTKAA